MKAYKHVYVGMLPNPFDIPIEILICGHCEKPLRLSASLRACWFGVDSSTLESPDVDVGCPYCNGLAPVDESANMVSVIKSTDELYVQVQELTQAIYSDTEPDNPPVQGTDVYDQDELWESVPDLFDDQME
jgi:hypothetical protein